MNIRILRISILSSMLLSGVLFTGCVTRMGVEPAKGILFDCTKGTHFLNTGESDLNLLVLKESPVEFNAYYLNAPLPYTFGALSFGWGNISNKQIMDKTRIKKLHYVEYRRLSILPVYTNYKINAYGEKEKYEIK